MGLGEVGRHGPFLGPRPCQSCFSSSHSHQEAILAVGDATAVMGGQVRGAQGRGLHWVDGSLFLSGSGAGWEL